MTGDKEIGFIIIGQRRPVLQGSVDIRVSCHDHPVCQVPLNDCFQLETYPQRYILFLRPELAQGAGLDSSVSRVNNYSFDILALGIPQQTTEGNQKNRQPQNVLFVLLDQFCLITILRIWRRRESNPRPKIFNERPLHVYLLPSSHLTASEEERHRKTSPDDVSLPRLRTNPVCYPACRRLSSAAGTHKRDGVPKN